jgi:iron complex transport system ATP-binding protein
VIDVPAAIPALALTDVSVEVHDERAGVARTLLRSVDLRVAPGEHWAVIGPNGAGKTTLLNVAVGSMTPASGTVAVLGERHGAEGLKDPRLRIGVIDAVPKVFASRLSALEVVTLRSSGPIALLGQRASPVDAKRARELLDLFGCAALMDRRYRDCSQGERQRIMLARALMRDPALLLLDEPTTGLDLPGRERLLEALARLAADRPALATIAVTHHVEELASSTTHAILLRGGACVAAGPVDETLTEHRLSDCFGVDVRLTRVDGRWSARASGAPA